MALVADQEIVAAPVFGLDIVAGALEVGQGIDFA